MVISRRGLLFAVAGCTLAMLSHGSVIHDAASDVTRTLTSSERMMQDAHDAVDTHDSHMHDDEETHDSHGHGETVDTHDSHMHDDEGEFSDDHDDHSGHDHDDHDDHDHGSETSELRAGDSKPWSEVILASLLINMTSLIGLLFVVCGLAAKKDSTGFLSSKLLTHNIIPAFAAGALLATCVFLIIPEAILLLTAHAVENYDADAHAGHDHRNLEEDEEGHDDHEDHVDVDVPVAWRFGASLLGGFLLPLISSLIFPHVSPEEADKRESEVSATEATSLKHDVAVPAGKKSEEVLYDADADADQAPRKSRHSSMHSAGTGFMTVGEGDESKLHGDVEANDEIQVKVGDKTLAVVAPVDYSLAASILLGDFFHNFTDGVFVGTAFLLCNRQLAITIAAATVYHELAQEIADYLLLTRHCNISSAVAIVLNFIGGLSILLGALLVMAFDISSNAKGCILAIGGGVYVYISGVECWPRVREAQESAKDKAISILCFVCGVFPIGLVLLNHGHCDA